MVCRNEKTLVRISVALLFVCVAVGCDQAYVVGYSPDASTHDVQSSRDAGNLADSGMNTVDAGELTLDGGDGDASISIDANVLLDAGPARCDGTMPELLVGLRSTTPSVPSTLARFTITAHGVTRCDDLTAGGALPVLHAAGFLDRNRIAVSGPQDFVIVDSERDRVVVQRVLDDPNLRPQDVFGIRDREGVLFAALAAKTQVGSISLFYMLQVESSEMTRLWARDLGESNLETCDASTLSSNAVLCALGFSGEVPLRTVALDGTGGEMLMPEAPGLMFAHIDVLGDRAVWATEVHRSGHDVRVSIGGLRAGRMSGPLRCVSELCNAPWELEDVAVDPTSPAGYFAICHGPGSIPRFHVIRGDGDRDGESCEVVIDGTTLPPGVTPVALDSRAL
jgi:hypothetical protein